ncbi:MAG: nucleotidyltransferase domain-containing protein [Candidatus Rokubacteria bacterium]|nr:nucleotidyltransferase domain-containing protein [Candidatus Rokubacteria bacterium]
MTLLERYEEILRRLLEEVRMAYGERLVACAVYGSVGRGTQRADSDVDLLLVVRGLPAGRLRRVEEFAPVEAQLESLLGPAGPGLAPVALSPVFKTPEELQAGSPLLLDMVEDARILHDPHNVLAARLDRLRARLRELGARRVPHGGGWYWELKPDLAPGEVFTL